MQIRPLRSRVLASSCELGARKTESGVLLLDDDGKEVGIRPRWFIVRAIGPEQKDVVPGQYILVSHGRWTWAATVHDKVNDEFVDDIRMIDENDILAVTDERPKDLDRYEITH